MNDKLTSWEMSQVKRYFAQYSTSSDFHVLDDKTCDDVNFDDLFAFVDHTCSCVGQQYLYSRMRHANYSKLKDEEELLSNLSDNNDLISKIRTLLNVLNNKKAYYISSLFQEENLLRPKHIGVLKCLSYVSFILLVGSFFNPLFILLLSFVFIVNAVLHYWNKRVLMPYLNSIPQFLKMLSVANKVFDIDQLKQIDPRLDEKLKTLKQLKRRMSVFSADMYLQGDIYALVWAIYEFVKILFLIEPIALYRALDELVSYRKDIDDVFTFVGKVDVLQSIVHLRAQCEVYCIPEVDDSFNGIVTDGVVHPLVANCVPNSIDTSLFSVLLTGSNMSGKTTFIKTLAVNAICASSINTCFAKTFKMPFVKLFTSIRISDDLLNDKSYYLEEVNRISIMLKQSKKPQTCLFVLDEIFKGTNTIERIAAGKAVLSYLKNNGNIVLVSTHDLELADLLYDEYSLYHFSELVDDDGVKFDYKLKRGPLEERNAIRILQVKDYPKQIIDEAMVIAATFDKENN